MRIEQRSREVRYQGIRTPKACRISRHDPAGDITDIFPGPSRKIRDHSPTGFEWGYGGSGPAQTALAIILDFTGDPVLAQDIHQDFKFAVVAQFDRETWELTGAQIQSAIDDIVKKRGGVRVSG